MNVQAKENIMAVLPVRRLLIHMSWPMMLSMLVQALYNTVDSIFVAQLNEAGFLALSLAFPVQTLMIAIQSGIGVGVNAVLSRRLGEGRQDLAEAVAAHGLVLYLLCWLLFLCFGLVGSRWFMTLYTSDPQVITYGTQYIAIVTVFSLGCCMQFAGERVLQATGNPIGPMLIQGVGAVVNLILDPIFIFGLFGFPRLEVAGAAIATAAGEMVGMVIAICMVRRNRVITLRLKGFRPQWDVTGDILRIGLPAVVMETLFTIMTLGMNKILAVFTQTGVFIMGAFFKIQSFIYMPVFGLTNGLTPAVSFNYGAHSRDRVDGLIRFALVITVAVMGAGTLIFLAIPDVLLSFFDANEAVMADGVPALRLLSLSFVTSGLSIVLSSAFQALESPSFSLALSTLRQIVVLLPLSLLLGILWGGQAIWWSFALAEGLCFLAALAIYRYLYRTRIAPLGQSQG